MATNYSEKTLKGLTVFSKILFVVLGLMCFLLIALSWLWLIPSIFCFVLAFKYKAKNKVDRTFNNQSEAMDLKYSYNDVQVAVIRGQEPNFNNIPIGAPVVIMKEPKNKFDKNAVKLLVNGEKIGYIYKGKLQTMINDFFSQNNNVTASVISIDKTHNKIIIKLDFYARKGYERKFDFDAE